MFRFRQIIFVLVILLASCSSPQKPAGCGPGGFAIYLPAETMTGAQIIKADLSKISLQAKPVIAAVEIISYTMQTHELRLKPEAIVRLAKMKVPVNGVGFVACAEQEPILGGAFWADYSSLSYDGVTIMKPMDEKALSVRFVRGYPGTLFDSKDDPLSDPHFLQVLDREGKLK